MAQEQSFLAMTRVHQWLDDCFLAHQTALLSLDLSQARKLLHLYEINIQAHMKDEEESLIPVYGERISAVPGGAVELFLGEHKKIRRFVAEFHDALKNVRTKKGLDLKHQIIALLDREAMYKGLLSHHHARERNTLFPWLDLLTSAEERSILLGQCASWSAYKAARNAKNRT